MSTLEDRLTRIIELRQEGKDKEAIGKELGIETSMVTYYEDSTAEALQQMMNHGITRVETLAMRAGISPILVMMALKQYSISTNRVEKRREDTITKDIRKLREQGMTSAEEIGRKIGLRAGAVRHHARLAQIEGIKRRPSSRRGYQERYQQIIQLLDRGILSAERIAEATGIKPTTIMTYRSTAEWRERWRSATQKAVESGDSLERICATTGLTPQALRNSCTRYGIILPEKEKQKKAKESKRKPEVDVLITEGKSLGEIGRTVKLTRERIRQYINATGQYEQWRKAREQRKEEQKTLEEHIDQQRTHILFLLKERMKILAKKDSWAAEKAVECWLNNKRYNEHSHSLETLLTILTRYEKAKNRGECLSLEQLGEGLSLWPSSIGIVLRKVGVEPMYGKRERKLTPQATKEALQRVHPILSLTNMSMTDISYFLGIPNYIVQQHHARYGITQKRPKRALCRDGKHGRYLTNAIASIIYKALDSGLSERKIAATLEVRPSFIDKAKELRPSIQPTIIQTLQILYNTRKIKTPYLP